MPQFEDVVPHLVCLGVDLAICGVLYLSHKSTEYIIKEMTAAPYVEIDENITETISNNPTCVRSPDTPGTCTLPYAVVRGEVAPLGKSVTSTCATDPHIHGVIHKVIFTEHKRNLSRTGFWVDSKRVLHTFTNDVPFSLSTTEDAIFKLQRPHVEVVDWKEATRVDMDTVYDHFENAGGGLGSHVLGWVVGDMQKGVQKTEEMLTKGTNLTGIGELVSDSQGVRLQPPSGGRPYYLVKNSWTSMIKEMESHKSFTKVMLGIFGGVGIMILSMAAWKLYKKRMVELKNRENQETLETIRRERTTRTPRPDGDVPENIQCVVCLSTEREVILLPCGHVCSCADCAEELLKAGHKCPVCRANIENVNPAYVS